MYPQPPIPKNEAERLDVLQRYGILDTTPEQAFDDLVHLATFICGTPIALITLVDSDRQWFKARVGLEIAETSREVAFCAHAINEPDKTMIVPDALQDQRFIHNPLVVEDPKIRFYAGAPLLTSDGFALGTLCVIDREPRTLNAQQIEALETLSRRVITELELRRDVNMLQREIARRKKAEAAILESEQRFRQLAENIPEVFWLSDPIDGHIIYVSPAFESTFQRSRESFYQQRSAFFESIHPDDREKVSKAGFLVGGSSQEYEFRIDLPEGGIRWIAAQAFPIQNESGLVYRIAGIAKDITERKNNEQVSARLAAIVESSQDAIIGRNLEEKIIDWNKGAERLYGYTAEEVIGKSILILAPPDRVHEVDDLLERLHRGESIPPFETERMAKDGRIIPVQIALSTIRGHNGEIIGTSTIAHDITARKRTERALQAAQERLQKEIEIAVEIQNSMSPKSLPELDGFEFAARTVPAHFLSGDFYEFISVDNHTSEVVLGDIAGKGIPAALLTLSLRTLIRDKSTPFPFTASASEILNAVNAEKYDEFSRMELFVTLFVAQVNSETGTFSYASAGHGEALIWRCAGGKIEQLPATGMPIGISRDDLYRGRTHLLRPGDLAVIFSDGITEAQNMKEEQFGLDRLRSAISEDTACSARQLVDNIEAAVLEFSEGHEQDDDISIIVIKAQPRTLSFSMPGVLDHLEKMVATIKESASRYSAEFAYEFELACSEIITDIIKYGDAPRNSELTIEINLREDGLQVDIYDHGKPFDLAATPLPDENAVQESGYGLAIARQLLDELECGPRALGGNHWRLVKFYKGE